MNVVKFDANLLGCLKYKDIIVSNQVRIIEVKQVTEYFENYSDYLLNKKTSVVTSTSYESKNNFEVNQNFLTDYYKDIFSRQLENEFIYQDSLKEIVGGGVFGALNIKSDEPATFDYFKFTKIEKLNLLEIEV